MPQRPLSGSLVETPTLGRLGVGRLGVVHKNINWEQLGTGIDILIDRVQNGEAYDSMFSNGKIGQFSNNFRRLIIR